MINFSFYADNFRILYGVLILFSFAMSMLFAPAYLGKHVRGIRFYGFSALVLIGTLGVFFAGDLTTLLVFFELMSLASYVWVAYEENKGALRAGDTYMAVAVMGGLSLLTGILILYSVTGTLDIAGIGAAVSHIPAESEGRLIAAAVFMFFGFGAKAGVFPIHVWLPKAHPVAPAPLSALLSGVLTKTGIFGIMIVGTQILPGNSGFGLFILSAGIITMAVGAVLAIFSTDLKKVLACSSVSQIGFMVTGIGAATVLSDELAIRGTVIHMMNHTLVKLVVFLIAGVVYENLHVLNLNEIKGFGRGRYGLMIPYILAALSLAGIPGSAGYFSKSILHEALVECGHILDPSLISCFEWIFLISGGATLCYMAKLFKVLFIDRSERELPKRCFFGPAQAVSVTAPAIIIAGLSVYLSFWKYRELFEFEVLKGGLTSVAIGCFLFSLLILTVCRGGDYRDVWPEWLDLEEKVYRPLLLTVLPLTVGFFARLMDVAGDRLVYAVRRTILRDAPLPADRVEGTVFTHVIGRTIDVFRAFVKGEHGVTNTTERHMALRHMELEETRMIIKRSLSFGLLLACMGILIILLFILLTVF